MSVSVNVNGAGKTYEHTVMKSLSGSLIRKSARRSEECSVAIVMSFELPQEKV